MENFKFYFNFCLNYGFRKYSNECGLFGIIQLATVFILYIQIKRCSLVTLKLENGWTDLNIYFLFCSLTLMWGWFKRKKKASETAWHS